MDGLCWRCWNREAYCKGCCMRCYYADRLGHTTYEEQAFARNWLEGDIGVVTDAKGRRWEVDRDDFSLVAAFLWTGNEVGYAKTRRKGYLHKLLVPQWKVVDHADRNPYNCRRSNLRDGSDGINILNKPFQESASRYRGVSRMRGRWQAVVGFRKERVYLGTFAEEEDAGRAVWNWAKMVGRTEFYRQPPQKFVF